MAEKFKVVNVRQIPSPNEGRLGRFDWLVTYQVGPFHTDIVAIPVDTLTPDIIREHVRKHLDLTQQFTNQEYTL